MKGSHQTRRTMWMSPEDDSLLISVSDKCATLSREYVCDNCGGPAMTREGDRLRCPSCWLREQGEKISRIDSGGYYP